MTIKNSIPIFQLHQNPCFYKRKATEEIVTLKQNCIADLNNGDKFGLLPNSFWYELLHCPDIPSESGDNAPSVQSNGAENPVATSQDDNTDAAASVTICNSNDDQELNAEDSALMDFDMNETVSNTERAESPSLIRKLCYSSLYFGVCVYSVCFTKLRVNKLVTEPWRQLRRRRLRGR